ncbi:MAG: septum formation initiator family protein [Hyphomicrobiaceae bacterium]
MLLVCCCLTAYFGFHAIHGKHGLEARSGLRSRAVALASDLQRLEAVRAALQREVTLLSDTGPDLAFIEELARDLLSFARPGDRILIEPRPVGRLGNHAAAAAAERTLPRPPMH